MGQPVTIDIVLGPAYCQTCDALVVWARCTGLRGSTGKLLRWRDPITGRQHVCPREGAIA